MKKPMILFVFLVIAIHLQAFEIDRERGIWSGLDSARRHRFDKPLCEEIIKFFKREKVKTIMDFGCGMGTYVATFRKNGFEANGCDGNPDTIELTKGLCEVKDLSQAFNLNKQFDWIVSLEVGEHIPKPYEKVFVNNLVRHCKKGIVLSWAVKGQRGAGHFNNQNNAYVKNMFDELGFDSEPEVEQTLRNASTRYWFKNTIMVFRKREN